MKDNKKTLINILSYLKPYRGFLVGSIIAAMITVAAMLYVPILIGDAIDCILGKDEVYFDKIIRLLVQIGIIILITALFQWVMNVCNNKVTFSVTRDIRNKAMEHIKNLPLKYIDGHSHGDIVSRVIADVDQFADGLLMGFTQLFSGVITILGTLGFLFSINVWIALIVIILTPVSLLVARFIANHTHSMFQMQSEIRGEQTAFIHEMIGGQKVVKAYGYEKTAQERFDEVNVRLSKYSLKAIFYSSLTNPCTRFVNSLVYVGVTVSGAIFVVSGRLTVGQLSCMMNYANQYTKPFNEISGVITELQNALTCVKRIFELIDEEIEEPDSETAIQLQEVKGEISIREVAFSYSEDKPLIENFNLEVKKGQRVAIVGPTGCGKTTFINLLMRFYEINQGEIFVDGQNCRKITRGSLREAFGMVLQDTWLKAGTVRENIIMGKPDATEEEILEACKLAHSYSFIKRLPKGLDTILLEDGGGLSQGQKQLLCITRVMLCLPPMLILDEATSSIDTRTEQQIQKAFAKMMEGRTSFIVAHRLSTIQSADIILVMKNGKIIEQGDHKSLLEKNGFYANLYESQFKVV